MTSPGPGYNYIAIRELRINNVTAFEPGMWVPDSTIASQGWTVGTDISAPGAVIPSPSVLTTTNYNATLDTKYAARYAVDLYDTEYGLKGDNTTDDTAALNSMVAAAYAALDNGTATTVRLHFRARTYLLAGAVTNPTGSGGAYAQIPLRTRALTASRDNIEFVGPARGPFTLNENQTTVQRAGTVFRSTATGTVDVGGKGVPSVIGGPACAGLNNDTSHSLSNTCVRLTDITVELPDNPSIAGVDLWSCEQARVHNFVQTTSAPLGSVSLPTHTHAAGLIMPRQLNNGASMTGVNYCYGAYTGPVISENTHVTNITTYQTVIGMGLAQGGNPSRVDFAALVWSNHMIAGWNASTGAVDLPATYVSFGLLSVEDGPAGNFAPVEHIKNGSNLVHIDGTFQRVASGVGPAGGITVTGPGGISLHDLFTGARTTSDPWHNVTLGQSWIAFGGAYAPPAYRLLSNGEVEIRGAMKSGNNGQAVFTLPAGYRPGFQRTFAVVGGGFTMAAVDVLTNGQVIIDAGTNTFLSLDGIKFLAEL